MSQILKVHKESIFLDCDHYSKHRKNDMFKFELSELVGRVKASVKLLVREGERFVA